MSGPVTRTPYSIAVRMYLAAEVASIADALRVEAASARCSVTLAEQVQHEAEAACFWALFDLNDPFAIDPRDRIAAVRDWCRDNAAAIEQVRGWADAVSGGPDTATPAV